MGRAEGLVALLVEPIAPPLDRCIAVPDAGAPQTPVLADTGITRPETSRSKIDQ